MIWSRYIPSVLLYMVAASACLLVWRGWTLRPQVALELISKNLEFDQPTMSGHYPGRATILYVVEKTGRIFVIDREQMTDKKIMLDLKDRVFSAGYEEGLFSLVFDPGFPTRPFVYAFYSLDAPLRSRISRFRMDPETMKADPGSELTILEIAKHAPDHNGGSLVFDESGYLLASVGDGSIKGRKAKDRILQDRSTRLGGVLRLDVSNSSKDAPFDIPPDNPFIEESVPELYAYGLRNVWRMTLTDGMLTGGDVGGTREEEINIIEPGANYGWPITEGYGCHYASDHDRCDRSNKVEPVVALGHDTMRSIIAGFVYKGKLLPKLGGHYIFACYQSGLFSVENLGKDSHYSSARQLLAAPVVRHGASLGQKLFISDLLEDRDGELLVTTLNAGIYRIEPRPWASQFKGFLYMILRFKVWQ